MKLFVRTKDKKYPIYFSLNSHINIKKILIKNNINPKKLMVVYDKNVPENITNKFKTIYNMSAFKLDFKNSNSPS